MTVSRAVLVELVVRALRLEAPYPASVLLDAAVGYETRGQRRTWHSIHAEARRILDAEAGDEWATQQQRDMETQRERWLAGRMAA